jgi:hypothetical protein
MKAKILDIFNHLTYLWWFVLSYCNYDDEASFRQILKPIIEYLLNKPEIGIKRTLNKPEIRMNRTLNKPEICINWTLNKPEICINRTLNKPEICLNRTLNSSFNIFKDILRLNFKDVRLSEPNHIGTNLCVRNRQLNQKSV